MGNEMEETNAAGLVPANGVNAVTTEGAEQSVLGIISRAAADPNTDVNKLERLMAMYERINEGQAKTAFSADMNAVQNEIKHVAADMSNNQTHSKYASYAALDRAIRPIYISHGFSVSFDTAETDKENYIRIICEVSHSAGYTKKYHIDMPADGKGAKGNDVMTKTHATGSAVTYGRRYLLGMAFNLSVGDDDDGNSAGASDCLTIQQYDELCELLEKTNSDPIKFVKYCGLDPNNTCTDIPYAFELLKLMPEKNYTKAVAEINRADMARKKKASEK